MRVEKLWYDFLNGKHKIVVHCDTEEKSDKLTWFLSDKDFVTLTRGTPFEINYDICKQNTCYEILDDKYVFYDHIQNFKEQGYTILNFNDIEKFIDNDISISEYFELKYRVIEYISEQNAKGLTKEYDEITKINAYELKEPILAYKILKKIEKEMMEHV